MQSRPDTFDESRFVMTFLTIFGVTEICNFRLVTEGKTGKEITKPSRLEFFKKFLANNCALFNEDSTSGPFNRGSIADLPLLRPLLAIRQIFIEPSFWEVMDSFVLLTYASLAASITLLLPLIASELYFRVRRFILLEQTKKEISMSYGNSTSSWKP